MREIELKECTVKTIPAPSQNPVQPRFRNCMHRAGIGTAAVFALLLAAPALIAQNLGTPFFLPSPVQVVSTVPANGDVNPYGVAFVPMSFAGGMLIPGDILVSN